MLKYLFTNFVVLLCTIFSTYGQELEEWEWNNRHIHFSSISDMEIVMNKEEIFEAKNDHISMYLKASDFNESSYEALGVALTNIVSSVTDIDESSMQHMEKENLTGFFYQIKIEGDDYIIFSMGNKLENVTVTGMILYDLSWERTALELLNTIYFEK